MVKGDVILVSHSHFDHSSAKTVSKKESKIVEREGTHKIRDLKIKGFSSFHDEVEGKKRGGNIIYRFDVSDFTLCHLGDLGHALDEKIIKQLGKVDILFIPVGGVFTLEPQQCWKVIGDIGPRLVVPMHYKTGGLTISIHTLDEFLKWSPEITRMKVGNEIDFDRADIPSTRTVWEFSL